MSTLILFMVTFAIMAKVTLEKINKRYISGVKEVHAVKDFTLDIYDREFIVLVGPSGCGKTTILRMIAGLEKISDGRIIIGDRVVNDLEPKDRDIAMVFQDYALYPHMTVRENLEFGLLMRRVPKSKRDESINKAAKILELEELLNRKPAQLSGGQKQRVALGRAIVREPKVFLFDEPLSNLDAKLRAEMRTEIKSLHRRLGVTTIYVTHDQVEAMTLGDRIVMIDKGTMQQVGNPIEVYNNPANKFVAGFLGTPPMNFIEGKVDTDSMVFRFDHFSCPLPEKFKTIPVDKLEKALTLGVRPEHIRVEKHANMPQGIPATVAVLEPLGNREIVILRVGENKIVAEVEPQGWLKPDLSVRIGFSPEHEYFFDIEGKRVQN